MGASVSPREGVGRPPPPPPTPRALSGSAGCQGPLRLPSSDPNRGEDVGVGVEAGARLHPGFRPTAAAPLLEARNTASFALSTGLIPAAAFVCVFPRVAYPDVFHTYTRKRTRTCGTETPPNTPPPIHVSTTQLPECISPPPTTLLLLPLPPLGTSQSPCGPRGKRRLHGDTPPQSEGPPTEVPAVRHGAGGLTAPVTPGEPGIGGREKRRSAASAPTSSQQHRSALTPSSDPGVKSQY